MATQIQCGFGGQIYQVAMPMLLLVRAQAKNYTNFCLQSEVEDAGAFDDVEFMTENEVQLIQLKLKANDKTVIKAQELFKQNPKVIKGDYNLLKYVISCQIIEDQIRFKTGTNKLTRAVLFTNISMDYDDKCNGIKIRELTGESANIFGDIRMIEAVNENLDNFDILYFANNEKVKYIKLNDPKLPKILMEIAGKFKEQIRSEPSLKSNEYNIWLTKNYDNVTEDKIKSSLEKIVFACSQPNKDELFNIVKSEIRQYCKMNNDNVYGKLMENIIEWMKAKKGEFPRKIDKQVMDKFFEKYAKVVTFNVTEPTDELNAIDSDLVLLFSLLNAEGILFITHSNEISKAYQTNTIEVKITHLVKMFCKKYKNDYFGRIIWICANNNKLIEESFRKLEELIWGRHSTLLLNFLIEKIIKHFIDCKILFIFDSAGNEPDDEQDDYVIIFREVMSSLSSNIHIIITSKDREYIDDSPKFELT